MMVICGLFGRWCKHLNIQDEAYKATTLHTHLHGAMKLFRVAVFAVLHINIFKWANLASGISKQSCSTIPHHLVTSMDQDQDQSSTTYEFLQPAGNLSICRIYSCILATKHPPPLPHTSITIFSNFLTAASCPLSHWFAGWAALGACNFANCLENQMDYHYQYLSYWDVAAMYHIEPIMVEHDHD